MFFEDNLVKYNNFSLILSIHFVKYKCITVLIIFLNITVVKYVPLL